MNPVSWARKEFARLLQKQRRLLLPQSSATTSKCLPLAPLQEVIVAADLSCGECERRVAGILSKIEDVESIVFHVLEKKVTLAGKITGK